MPSATPSRQRLAEVIARRPQGNLGIGLVIALAFALGVTPIVMAESWLVEARVVAGEPAPVTVRVRAFDGYDDGAVVARGGAVVVARGQVATEEQAAIAEGSRRTAPRGLAGFAAYAAVLFLLAAAVTHHMRRSNRGKLLRVQLVLLGTVAAGAALTKGLLLLWPVSVLAVPVALGAVVPTLVFDRTVGLAGGVLAAVVMSLLVPFDVGVSTVLVVQAVAAAIVIPEHTRLRWSIALTAGVAATAGAVLTYAGFSYLSLGYVPLDELSHPASSSWLASAVGGVMAGVLAVPLLTLFQMACGEITQGKLVQLEDLSHPLLRQIAEKAPGTWQHSLAMANMAEIAANSIGASGRLVRVGAYFHDLGKSLQPPYFIENLQAGEPSPHDRLAPEVSCDAIFAHVTEGIALARRQKLPERIIDFMHMHHGDGVLEYFWAKCQEQGNPRRLTVDDFRYPGVPPQSRETAILAICDAVEAASRTLKRPDARSIENLVQRIVYGKLHLGQLDESGLSMADLRRINDSLRETIKHAHHGRIEYPWQREAAADGAAAEPSTGPTVMGRPATATQQLMQEPRLDSLDVPRPLQWEDTGRPRAAATPPAGHAVQPEPAAAAASASAAAVAATSAEIGGLSTMPMHALATAARAAAAEPLPGASATMPAGLLAASFTTGPVTAPPRSGAIPAGPIPTTLVGVPAPPMGSSQVAPMPQPGSDVVTEPLRSATPTGEVVLLTPDMSVQNLVLADSVPSRLPDESVRQQVTAPMPAAQPPAITGSMPVVAPAMTDEMAAVAPIVLDPTSTGPMVAPLGGGVTETQPISPAALAASAQSGLGAPLPTGPVPSTLTGAAGPILRAPGTPSTSVSQPMPAAPPPPPRPFAEPPTEPFAAALVELAKSEAPPPTAQPPEPPRTSWAATLAARLDNMLDEEDDDAFAAEPTKRQPPPPPPGRPRTRVTHEVEADDVEATIELNPHARAEPSGLIMGPPPATRPVRPATQGTVTEGSMGAPAKAGQAAPPAAHAAIDTGFDGDEGPTVVRKPAGSMLPPRARKPEP